MEWKGIGGSYQAKLETGKLTGTWQQGTVSLPLALERTNRPVELNKR